MGKLLYSPDKQTVENAEITTFMHFFAEKNGLDLNNYHDFHRASLTHKGQFWDNLREFYGVIGDFSGPALDVGSHMKFDQYFPEARLNYAENLLAPFADADDMLVFSSERQNYRKLDAATVRNHVTALASYMRDNDICKGDRVAAVMPNMPETVTTMLAATSLGAVWASCSPDFGVESIIDRFGQIRPKIVIICDQYRYNGKMIDLSKHIAALQERMTEVKKFIIVPFEEELNSAVKPTDKTASYLDIITQNQGTQLKFTPVGFRDPLFIMFSSGTTGVPKCIVHSVGGTLLQHIKEHRLHCNLKKGDRFFYYTTCGWMMWNWSVTALASGMPLLLYDGSPFAPDQNVIFDYITSEKAAIFGTSAKFIDAVRKSDFVPKEHYNFKDLKIVTSTGSPLSEEGFQFVYDGIKSECQLASISGGTDIISCFVLGCPTLPVISGEIQCAGLAMDVDVYDEAGSPMASGKGELVCKSSFPSMPIGFWNDFNGSKYHDAYFARYENIWAHGDFAEKTENNGLIIHGRSDTVLNPGGVRIGTSEIYRQVEKFNEVMDSVCVGQKWEDDVRVVLFVKMREGLELSDDLVIKIKKEIRAGTSPRHVPAIVKSVPDIPRTKSGKITETAVRDIIHGVDIKNKGALANPEALEHYRNIV